MAWADAAVGDQALREAYAEVYDLAEWSRWFPFETARPAAPREPGRTLVHYASSTMSSSGRLSTISIVSRLTVTIRLSRSMM